MRLIKNMQNPHQAAYWLSTSFVLLFFTCILVSPFTQATEIATGEPIVIGVRHTIASQALGGARHIRVQLPEGHTTDGGKEWPVLYVLDGQRYFTHGIALSRSLNDFDLVPGLIVVGIESPASHQQRLTDFTDNAAAYQRFLSDELLPFMARHYGAGKVRVLFGWQYAGRMVLNSLINKPGLFDTYVIASPWPNNRELVAQLASSLQASSGSAAKLVLAVADNEGIVTQGGEYLKTTLEAHAGKKLAWTYKVYNDEEHSSTAYRTIAVGLNAAFADYRWLRFNSVAAYKAFGGVDAVRAHYAARGQKYGIAAEVVNETIHQIAMVAESEDDIKTMAEILAAFPDYIQHANASWLTVFGKLYLKHGWLNEAQALFAVAVKRFPDDEDVRQNLLAAEQALNSI